MREVQNVFCSLPMLTGSPYLFMPKCSRCLRSVLPKRRRQIPRRRCLSAIRLRPILLWTRLLGWDKLKPDLVALYTSQFSETELNQLIAFYESPLGKKMLSKLPELNARSVQLTQVNLESAVPEVNNLLSEMTAELEKQKP